MRNSESPYHWLIKPHKHTTKYGTVVVLVGLLSTAVGLVHHTEAVKLRAQTKEGRAPVLIPDLSVATLSGSLFAGKGVADTLFVSSMGVGGSDTEIADIYTDADVTDITTYIVKDGDTIESVASLFRVSVNTVVWQNGLEREQKLKQGQELIILPTDGVTIKIRKGDTIGLLARTYKGDIDDIKKFNGITSDSELKIGDKVIIPGGILPETVAGRPTKPIPTGTTKQIFSRALVVDGYLHPLNGRGVKTQGYHDRWRAIDIGAPTGTPIFASSDGIVAISNRSGWGGGYGLYTLIKHKNGSMTMSAHMSRVAVTPGQSVEQGQIIGYVGSTGRSTGPHIHFEIRNGPIFPPW